MGRQSSSPNEMGNWEQKKTGGDGWGEFFIMFLTQFDPAEVLLRALNMSVFDNQCVFNIVE